MNQTKYGQIEVVNFTIDQVNHCCKTVILKLIQKLEEYNLQIYYFNIKNLYIDKLDDVVDKNNNTYHSTIKVNPIDVKSSAYFDSEAEKL